MANNLATTTDQTTDMKANEFFATIRTNYRDLIHFIAFGLGLAVAGGVVDYAAARWGGTTFADLILPPLANYLQGFSRFAGAAICATFVWLLLWPTVNRWSNESFKVGWEALFLGERLRIYVALVIAALIAAAICFSA